MSPLPTANRQRMVNRRFDACLSPIWLHGTLAIGRLPYPYLLTKIVQHLACVFQEFQMHQPK